MKLKLLSWAILIGVLAYFVLITPDNPIMRALRGEISDISSNVITGPYPVSSDFEKLKKNGVIKVVSLLDPAIPYEKSLLDQERVEAKRLQIEFVNYPMISILGHKMGVNYEKNAAAAADDIAASKGKVYVHCYLGIHRIMVVKKRLQEKNIKTARYMPKEGERDQLSIELDKAEQLYNQRYYKESRSVLDSVSKLSPAGKLLYAWVVYHQHDYVEARKRFTAMAEFSSFSTDMNIGLAYCDLQENKLASAIDIFSLIIKNQPENESALTGMGIALHRLGKPKEAAAYLEKALRINPDNVDAGLILKQTSAAAS